MSRLKRPLASTARRSVDISSPRFSGQKENEGFLRENHHRTENTENRDSMATLHSSAGLVGNPALMGKAPRQAPNRQKPVDTSAIQDRLSKSRQMDDAIVKTMGELVSRICELEDRQDRVLADSQSHGKRPQPADTTSKLVMDACVKERDYYMNLLEREIAVTSELREQLKVREKTYEEALRAREELRVSSEETSRKLEGLRAELTEKSKVIEKLWSEKSTGGQMESGKYDEEGEKSKNIISSLREELDKMQRELVVNSSELSRVTSRASEMENVNEKLRHEVNSEREFSADVKKKMLHLENEKDRLSLSAKEACQRADYVERDLMALRDIKFSLSEQVSSLKKECEGMERSNQAIQQEKENLALSLEVASRRADQLEQQLCDLKNENHALSSEIANLKCAMETTERSHREEINDLNLTLHRQVEELHSENEKERTKSESLERELLSVRGQRDQLQSLTQSQELMLVTCKTDLLSKEMSLKASTSENTELREKVEDLFLRLDFQLRTIAEMDDEIREVESMRRKLHNTVQELKGNIRVFCRLRPSAGDNSTEGIYKTSERHGLIDAFQPGTRQKWSFEFDHVFGPQADQSIVFDEVSQVVQSALDGYRVCLFAYGQTGSGKTHTMLGGPNSEAAGIIPRSIGKIFTQAEKLKSQGWTFELDASFLEIYNESIQDLLADSPSSRYEIKQDRDSKQVYVTDLTSVRVNCPVQILELLERSTRRRATAATSMNERSSRSHSVFQLRIRGQNGLTGQELDGLLNLIDLAGSERLASSQSTGERLRETQHINKSLSALGDVIAALANKEKHIPYRNSKLTYLLQDSLGGDCKTLMFVNLSPEQDSFNESLCSLRFASKVNACDIGTARRKVKIDLDLAE